MQAYYNEFDPFAAKWLMNLVKANKIMSGIVDHRSILDLEPGSLVPAMQMFGVIRAHFFAGIGGWDLALQLAGWPEDAEVWTGSPPCQPFSDIGKRKGKDDERHLLPKWLDLVREAKPYCIFGEQVEAAIRYGWLDDLYDAMEAEGYACWAVVLPACSVGAPHIRHRLFFACFRMGDISSTGLERHSGYEDKIRDALKSGSTPKASSQLDRRLADSDSHINQADSRRGCGKAPSKARDDIGGGGVANGRDGLSNSIVSQWGSPDWLGCRDQKLRPVQSGTFPVADGVPGRVGRIRAYGNAIVPQVAAIFIRQTMKFLTSEEG